MAEIKRTLKHGLKIGDTVYKELTMKSADGGIHFTAQEKSEKLAELSTGPEWVSSPTLVLVNALCLQVVSIGEHSGPLEIQELHSLHEEDIAIMMDVVEKLRAPDLNDISQAVSARGRSDSSDTD